MRSKLGLGTVQFGTPYGVANTTGVPSVTEIAAIVSAAVEQGIGLLDTAPAYGESEARLGVCLLDEIPMRIVSKTPRLIDLHHRPSWFELFRTSLMQSLERLCQGSLYCLLIHNLAEIPTDEMTAVVSALKQIRSEGLTEKIGASIYDDAEVQSVAEWADVVQLPLNVFNQSHWSSGNMKYLRERGVEIHVRSVLLQGLVVLPPSQLNACFFPVQDALELFHSSCRNVGITPLAASMGFACHNPLVDHVIVGVERIEQLQPLIDASETDVSGIDFDAFDDALGALGDPRNWPVIQ